MLCVLTGQSTHFINTKICVACVAGGFFAKMVPYQHTTFCVDKPPPAYQHNQRADLVFFRVFPKFGNLVLLVLLKKVKIRDLR